MVACGHDKHDGARRYSVKSGRERSYIPRKAHDAFNFDDDEEQNAEDYKLVLQEEKDRVERENYGGMSFDDKDYFSDGVNNANSE